jgi:hypothetical protein
LTAIFVLLGTLGTLSLLLLFYILAKLSERFGSVIKMRPLYRSYYAAIFFLAAGYASHSLWAVSYLAPESVPVWLTSTWLTFLTYHLSLAIGVTIGLVTTWRYWSWLVAEYNG